MVVGETHHFRKPPYIFTQVPTSKFPHPWTWTQKSLDNPASEPSKKNGTCSLKPCKPTKNQSLIPQAGKGNKKPTTTQPKKNKPTPVKQPKKNRHHQPHTKTPQWNKIIPQDHGSSSLGSNHPWLSGSGLSIRIGGLQLGTWGKCGGRMIQRLELNTPNWNTPRNKRLPARLWRGFPSHSCLGDCWGAPGFGVW